MRPHPQAEILITFAHGETIQVQDVQKPDKWTTVDTPLGIIENPRFRFRIKPDLVEINGHEFKRPCQVPLAIGQKYYRTSVVNPLDPVDQVWNDTLRDKNALEYGMVHLERKEAVTHGLALVSFTRKQHD